MREGFGEVLRRLRIGAGFTQERLAEQANVSAAAIAALEAGRRRAPRLTTVRSLIDALGLVPVQRDELLAAATRHRIDHRPAGPVTPATTEPSSPDARIGNLPAQRTRFVGRSDAVGHIGCTIAKERLVTLIGPGGVGKTRLALAIAESVADDFGDGCWFVPLSSLTEPTMVANSLADALGLGRLLGANVSDGLRDWFARHRALIVLDNCEHLRGGVAAVVHHVLGVESDSRIVATSQVPLGVTGEVLRPVFPLAFDATGGESVEFFVDRARAVKSDFELNERNTGAVHEICAKLDHVPLGIELAASRVRAMNPTEIAKRLHRRDGFLVNRDTDAPERHRSLLHAVRWSVGLLTEKEKTVLHRLSVFAAPFDLDAAEFVCSGVDVDEFEVFEVVLGLVDKSLVMPIESGETTRYTLLETIRGFGRDALATSSDLEFRTRRYAQYYIDLVNEHSDAMLGPDDQRAFRVVEQEWDHIRATLNIMRDTTDSADFDRLYFHLAPVWIGAQRSAEGAQWGETLLARPILDPAARVVALSAASSSATLVHSPHAAELCQRAIALWREHDTAPPLTAHGYSAVQALMTGDYQRSRDQAVLTIEMSRTVVAAGYDYLAGVIAAHSVLGFSSEHDLLASVRAHLEELMRTGSVWFRIAVRSSIGFRMFLTKHPDAIAYFRETLRLCVESNNVLEEMMSSIFLGSRLFEDGRPDEAAAPIARVIELARVHGSAHLGAAISRAVVILTAANPTASAKILGGAAAMPNHYVLSSGTEDLATLRQTCENELKSTLGDATFADAYQQGTGLDEAALAELCITSLRQLTAEDGRRT